MEEIKLKNNDLSEAGIQMIFEKRDQAKANGSPHPVQKVLAPDPPHQKPNTSFYEEDQISGIKVF
jgi:hypothetical protein